MALKASHLFSCIFLLFILLSLQCNAKYSNTKDEKSSSPFHFIKHLNGAKKGDNIKGLQKVKTLLQHFGYLSYQTTNDEFNNLLRCV
ncbi:hypothetical protein ACSBR2_030390 [Camellia fascicularis]